MRKIVALLVIVLVLSAVGASGAFGGAYVRFSNVALGGAIYGLLVAFVFALLEVGARADESQS